MKSGRISGISKLYIPSKTKNLSLERLGYLSVKLKHTHKNYKKRNKQTMLHYSVKNIGRFFFFNIGNYLGQ